MEAQPFVIFSLNGSLYGIQALCVEEVFFLPELTPVVEAPPDIAGAINLRGEIVPLVDLRRRFGHAWQPYSLSDSAIVLKWQNYRIGIIVNQVRDVVAIAPSAITTDLSYGRAWKPSIALSDSPIKARFVEGIAQVDADIIMLLNPENLFHHSESVELSLANIAPNEVQPLSSQDTPLQTQQIFRQRAENLRHRLQSQDFAGLMPVAIVGLNQEYFGLDLSLVCEFTEVRQLTPIPCCPSHIVGNMNLRGEIVTLVDIRPILNLPVTRVRNISKAMVVQSSDLVAGIIVDEVFDVMYLLPSQIKPIPTAAHSQDEEYLRGTAPYREKMLSILDLAKIFAQGVLTVNEEI